ncbi:MAG TPA: Wzz/FepE/Etk N-terminal domain-containing protein [Bacteroidales bacterium]|nr:Wzz/FepE/Etk N-terminal domain-containing protein [Bacteroidales bacterium]
MEDYFTSKNILNILFRWKYHLIIIVVAAIILATFFSSAIFITPLYKSTALVYPSNVAPYSDESQTEQMMQILQSKDIRDSIINKFDLPGHYGVDRNYEYYSSTILWEYGKKIKVAKTPYEAIEIDVWDKDPAFACNIVNEILNQYNFKVRGLQKEKFLEVVNNYRTVADYKKKELDSLQSMANELGTKYGLLDFPNQTREVMRAYLSGGSSVRGRDVATMKKNLEEKGGSRELLSNLMIAETKDYSTLKLAYDQAVLDYNRNYTFVNILSKPFPADKKGYPIRWVIVLASAFAALFLAIMIIGIIDRRRTQISGTIHSTRS